MPKKTKKKAANKRTKKAAVKKTAKKKTTKKAMRKAPSRNKKRSTGGSARTVSTKPIGSELQTPDICTGSFTASNDDGVEFQNIPAGTTVTLYQKSATDYYPFTPYLTDGDGLRYTEIAAGDELTIVVPTLNKTYYYRVEGDANCPSDAPGHSVTVNS
jgi:hypothetical protein